VQRHDPSSVASYCDQRATPRRRNRERPRPGPPRNSRCTRHRR
jgi:hypothetical protein